MSKLPQMNHMTSNARPDIEGTAQDIGRILSPLTIRERAASLYRLACEGRTHFAVHPEKLDEVSDLVVAMTRELYPTLEIPFHSRWNHFQAGGVDRLSRLALALDRAGLSAKDRARAKIDLGVVSVLLDAGAGPTWTYTDPSTQKKFSRSEGLAVASFDLFIAGTFSADPQAPYRVDAEGLNQLTRETLARGFQVDPEKNPMAGFDGRFELLKSLGRLLGPELMESQGSPYGLTLQGCPSALLDYFENSQSSAGIAGVEILNGVQRGLGTIWPGRVTINKFNLGDVWHYAPLWHGGEQDSTHFGPTDALVPFHKLSQWMSYSLVEPLQEAGINVFDIDGLTGLAEYRNGGLVLDGGLIALRNPEDALREHHPGAEIIVEWRALTLYWLDRIGEMVRVKLGRPDLPLTKVLEGGTWWVGRRLAAKLRDGSPPLKLISDGTVF